MCRHNKIKNKKKYHLHKKTTASFISSVDIELVLVNFSLSIPMFKVLLQPISWSWKFYPYAMFVPSVTKCRCPFYERWSLTHCASHHVVMLLCYRGSSCSVNFVAGVVLTLGIESRVWNMLSTWSSTELLPQSLFVFALIKI